MSNNNDFWGPFFSLKPCKTSWFLPFLCLQTCRGQAAHSSSECSSRGPKAKTLACWPLAPPTCAWPSCTGVPQGGSVWSSEGRSLTLQCPPWVARLLWCFLQQWCGALMDYNSFPLDTDLCALQPCFWVYVWAFHLKRFDPVHVQAIIIFRQASAVVHHVHILVCMPLHNQTYSFWNIYILLECRCWWHLLCMTLLLIFNRKVNLKTDTGMPCTYISRKQWEMYILNRTFAIQSVATYLYGSVQHWQ